VKNADLHVAVALAARVGHALVATADAAGLPHMAAVARVEHPGRNFVALTEWFCPGTLANLGRNKQVAVVIWDRHGDTGFQLLGRVAQTEDVAMLDGYSPAAEKHPVPQCEVRLVVHVEKLLAFTLRPHTDVEE
jgi:uncharacterized protein